MAETGNHHDDAVVEQLFEGAKRHPSTPQGDFMARLEADMVANAPSTVKGQPIAPGHGFLRQFQRLFAASGLTGVAALGVWIGFVMPETVNALTEGLQGTEVIGIETFLPSADLGSLSE